jgi:hypothetical protein
MHPDSPPSADLVDMVQEVAWILVDADGACLPLSSPIPNARQRVAASISQILFPTTIALSMGTPRRSAAARNRSGFA